jgi:hypothetical protein
LKKLIFNPSLINFDALDSLPLSLIRKFPTTPAVYIALDSSNNVLYIGLARNPKSRWNGHQCYDTLNKLGGVRIAFLHVDSLKLLYSLEYVLISWFKPPLNRRIKSNFPAELEEMIVEESYEVCNGDFSQMLQIIVEQYFLNKNNEK